MKNPWKFITASLVLVAILFPVASKAQSDAEVRKFQYEIGYQFSLGLSERSNGETFHRSDIDMDGNAVKIAALYNFNRRISAGLGLSFVGYDPNPNSLPLYAILRYRPFDGKWNNLYAFTNLGYSLGKSGSEDLCSGFAGELGIGWQMHLYKRLGLNFGISYGLNQFNKLNATGIYGDESNLATPSKLTRKDVWRNSLNFSVALVF